MFRIGEFSKIAQTAISQLRYYDQIGLFQPAYTDESTGYRYYSTKQLPELNRILSLKELGVSLEQIKKMVLEEVSAQEIRGMLMLRKAQVEQTVQQEINRLKIIEARLKEVEQPENLIGDGIILKSTSAQPFYSTRKVMPSLFDTIYLVTELRERVPAMLGQELLGHLTIIIHGDAFSIENADIEVGFPLEKMVETPLLLPGGDEVSARMLQQEGKVISAMRVGSFENGYEKYAQIGRWIENSDFHISGPAREVFIQPPSQDDPDGCVCEIQFPVTRSTSLV
ncbi:MerR family transcriptional regulator [Thalassomonas actiniarum]|uniref:MerR family transcriptional regulator n=1 Tax=Thalassomonas actiniarum TaxID=485447 RepID=A0AAE9YR89_9GAMM|nr:MerR family transcriptional regulator [Thalassomonas actiniarum]WDD98808.1 MerR family transcriptional regulator [Thalassomonas actiniarum]